MHHQDSKSPWIQGLNHLGIVVEDIGMAKSFFIDILGLELIEDRGELCFIKAGSDILALKTPRMAVNKPEYQDAPLEQASRPLAKSNSWQSLDHYGFFAPSPERVDEMAAHLMSHNIQILKGPYDRRDGRSLYFRDPCGLVGEYFYFRT